MGYVYIHIHIHIYIYIHIIIFSWICFLDFGTGSLKMLGTTRNPRLFFNFSCEHLAHTGINPEFARSIWHRMVFLHNWSNHLFFFDIEIQQHRHLKGSAFFVNSCYFNRQWWNSQPRPGVARLLLLFFGVSVVWNRRWADIRIPEQPLGESIGRSYVVL